MPAEAHLRPVGRLSALLRPVWKNALEVGLRPVLLTILLSGCTAMAPGMHFDQAQIPATPVQAKDPIIKPITPQLVQQESVLFNDLNLRPGGYGYPYQYGRQRPAPLRWTGRLKVPQADAEARAATSDAPAS